jgi:mannan endo-1,4-beta-mannosidase
MNHRPCLTVPGTVPPSGRGEATHTSGGIAALDDTQRPGRHRRASSRLRNRVRHYRPWLAAFESHYRDAARPTPQPRPDRGRSGRRKLARIVAIAAAIMTTAAIALVAGLHGWFAGDKSVDPTAPSAGPIAPGTYLGVYAAGVPESYAGVRAFSANTGVRPGVVVYYSAWLERFRVRFAKTVAKHDAVPLVQINPTKVSLTAIASGRYDAYLRSYASAVKAFGGRVILSFGHEMNGSWYSWGYRHASPAAFVAAWRHIVTVFRHQGADNVIWLWTVNIIQCRCRILSPAPWWPGSSYVTWVGIDGYYYKSSWQFAPLFGPTIKAVRALTLDPILISETSALAASQPAKIADLFAGIRAYGLLGFVWFDVKNWHISGPAASAAFRHGVDTLKRSAS